MEEKVIVKSPVVRRSGPMSIVDETFAKRAPLVIFVAVAAALMIVSSARAAQFRQLPELPVIPPSITFSGERDFLQADLDRLKVRITAVEGKRATHHRDCGQRLMSNVTRKRQCSFLAQEIHRDSSRLRTAISSLRSRFGEIERNALQRRQSGASGVSGAGRAVREPVRDRRPKLMADALAAGDGSWKDLLAHVKSMMDRGAGDPAVRDVSAYLTGLYSGQMAADVLNDAYYKHGVRRALAGDHWSATLAFARAARDRPDDLRVFESFADAAGRQHAGPACIQSGRCVSGNVAQWAKQFGNKHEQALKKIIAAERKRKLSLNVAGTFRVLRAAAVYATKKEAGEVAYPPAVIRGMNWPHKRLRRRVAVTGQRRSDCMSGYGKKPSRAAQAFFSPDMLRRLAPRRLKHCLTGTLTRRRRQRAIGNTLMCSGGPTHRGMITVRLPAR